MNERIRELLALAKTETAQRLRLYYTLEELIDLDQELRELPLWYGISYPKLVTRQKITLDQFGSRVFAALRHREGW